MHERHISMRFGKSALICAYLWIIFVVLSGSIFAAPNPEPYPQPASKKGLQVQMVDDALALGIKHAGLNCHLASFVDLEPQPDSLRWSFDGQDYFFKKAAVERLDAQVQPLSHAGVVVSLILLNYENGDEALNTIFLHPKYDRAAKTNRMSAFNVVTPEGVRWLHAATAFLAQRYSEPGGSYGRVWNYIVGNEVNSHWWWNNMGRATAAEVASDYERAVRIVHDAVRTASENARVFLSLEHHWAMRYAAGEADQSCPGRELLETFARLARERGDFDWHLAYHPYPEDLGEPCFWRDKTALPAEDSPRITFKNLEILPRFLARPELQYAGQARRIILSEQGFHCPDRPEGERDQAAAYCAAWWKVAHLDGIDAFILHRHVDHAHEGLNLGLWTHAPDTISTPERHRQMYEVFRLADTPEWEKAFAFALPVIGIQRWEELSPDRR
jgi:hypothetical protein